MTATVTYLGDLRTQCVHTTSQSEFVTDAPPDNQGKGEAFSPTDTVATALASCMFTVMGIKARQLGIDFTGATAAVTKIMASDPRRISKIIVVVKMPLAADMKTQYILENTARTCPVLYSLHPDIEKELVFSWLPS